MTSLARQVKGGDPNKKGYAVLPVGCWAWGSKAHPVKNVFVEKLLKSDTGHTTQHEQGFKSGNVELAVPVDKWPTAEH
jgi:hypothetical protein